MKKRVILTGILCMVLAFSGCGSSSSRSAAAESAAYDGGSYKASNDFTTAEAAMDYDEAVAAEEAPASGAAEEVTEAEVAEYGSKIIRNADLSMDVTDLNEFAENLKKTVNDYNGYVERSDVNDYDSDYSEYRYGYFTVRIPAAKLDDFLSIVEGEGTITSKSETAEDVTSQYVDIEAHIDTYEAERDSLMQLMNKAEDVEDILKIREQLRDINYELDSLQRQLKAMQNKVSYSTVTVNAKETRSIMGGTSKKKSFWGRIGEKFAEEFADGWEIALDVLIFIVTRIPLFAILGVFVFIVVKIIKKISGKEGKKEKKAKNGPASGPANTQAQTGHITSNVTPEQNGSDKPQDK